MTTPVYDQDAFRGRDDDVTLNSATFNGGAALNTNWSQDVDTNFRVRFVVQETAGGKLNNGTFELWYSLNGGAYAEMTATTPVQPAATLQYANGDTTSQVIGSGTYTTGDSLAGVDNATDTGNVDLNGNDEFECEWCLTIDSAQVSNGNTIALRVYLSGGTSFGGSGYTNTPTITVVESSAITMPADAGSLNFTGTAATLKAARKITAAAGSLTFTGTAAGLAKGRVLTAEAGSFTLAGTAAALTVTRKLTAAAGAFTFAGTAADLKKGRTLAAEAGAFTLSGTAATLTATRKLTAAAGSLTFTGSAATLAKGLTLIAEAGALSLSGTSAALLVARSLTADAGALALSGTAATLKRDAVLNAEAGTLTLTGVQAALIVGYVLTLEAGALTLSGTAATLTYSTGSGGTVPAVVYYQNVTLGS